jgi:CubicO group peptidase (beta-lactamase class C family)
VGIPDIVLTAENVFAGEFFNVLDPQAVPRTGSEGTPRSVAVHALVSPWRQHASQPPKALIPLFKPGTGWAYSNTDYVLAGMIIQKLTGQNWATEVYDRIICPLGLRHTFVPCAWPYLPAPHADLYQQFRDMASPEESGA